MRWNFCWLKPQKYWSRKSNKKRTLQVLRSSDCRRLSFCLCRARAMKILQITSEVPNRVEKPSPRFPVEGETNDKKMRKRTRPNEEYQMLFRYNGSSTFSEKKRKNVHNLKRIGEKYLLTKIVNICPGDAHFEVKKGHLFCQVTNNKVNRNEIQNNTHVGSDL